MTIGVASLGMYDHPAVQDANDTLWAAIAARLRAAGIAGVPERLDRARPLEAIWDDPALILAQTCGYPLATRWAGRLRYAATPRYAAPGCEGAFYRSRLVVRSDDPGETLGAFRGRRAALNDRQSNSGMNLFRASVASHAGGRAFFGSVVETGSHAQSVALVASGGADIAAIDAVSFAHLSQHDPATASRLRTLGWTARSPGLPLVIAAGASDRTVRILRRVLRDVARDDSLAHTRRRLLIEGFDVLPRARYRSILGQEAKAVRAGYPVLA